MALPEVVFYRYVSRTEVEAIGETGMLRGGRPGRTYWTEEFYETAAEAKAKLALAEPAPAARVAFRIRNRPNVRRRGDVVLPAAGEPGGGTEWMSTEPVEVEVISIDALA